MWPNPQISADLVLFTEEILNGKLHFLCSDSIANSDPNLHEISSKDFGITKLKYLTIAPTSQVNNYFGSEG